jgi:alkylhydroperoxidase family enzyme
LRAVLGLLEKMTLSHESLGPDDVRAVLATGVSKEAIAEAMEVAFLFNVYDRLADTMGWHVPDKESGYYNVSAKRLLKDGYA